MAVHPFLPGLAVEIIVNDAPLPEYDDDTDAGDSPTMVTKYVEATSGANFAVEVAFTEEFPFPKGDMRAGTSVDGRLLSSRIIREDYFFEKFLVEGRKCEIGQHSKIQKFCFSELEVGKCAVESN
jgi:hypothetical protein